MKITKRLVSHLPDFYRVWDENSTIFKFLFAFGKRLDECDQDLTLILKSHWVDTAKGKDLDKLAAIFSLKRRVGEDDRSFRRRIKRAIIDFKGGGTKSTIISSIKTFLELPEEYPLELIENPEQEMVKSFVVRTGTTWEMSSLSIMDAEPEITIRVLSEGLEARNPQLINLDTGESITFKGILKKGDELKLSNKGFKLNGLDVSSKVSPKKIPTLTRRKTRWRYVESIEKTMGVFNQSKFNESIFAVGIPEVEVTFKWVSRLPAAFKVLIPREALEAKGVSKGDVEEIINLVKAVGVKSIVEVV